MAAAFKRWLRLSCPHCGDIWSSDLEDSNSYECALCGLSGVGVVIALVREDKGAVEALREIQRIAAIEDSYDVDPRKQYEQVKQVQAIVSAALGGQ